MAAFTPHLKIVQGIEPGKEFPLESERSTIGRSSDCEISLDVAAVSRRHAAVIRSGGGFTVEDLGSRNGTFVNGQRIATPTPLSAGDRIVVCDQEFSFEAPIPAGALNSPPILGGPQLNEESGLVNSSAYADESRFGEESKDGDESEFGDEESSSSANVMATIDMGSGASSWSMSARPEVKLAALIEIAQGLGRSLSINAVLPNLLDSLFKIFTQADRGFVIMRPKPDAPFVPVAAKSRRGDDDVGMRVSKTIVEEAVGGKKAILSADATSDERFGMAESIADFQIRSMMCVPLINSDGDALGVIQVDTMNQRHRFTDDDLEVLAAVASQAAVAVDNAQMHDRMLAQQALERDLQLAHRMQRALLPSRPPQAAGYGFFDYYESARQVGGDYYDYVPLPGGRFAVVLGDVAGKGVAAAIVMAKLSSDVRFALATEPDLASAVNYVNHAFAEQELEDRFVTMIFAVVDPQSHKVTMVNAGHMAPLLRKASGEVVEVAEEDSGLPIGVFDGYEYEEVSLELNAGESITTFTDGFSEAMNSSRDLYGLERLAEQVAQPAGTVEELGKHVLEDVRTFVDGYAQSDDMCLCCFGRGAE